MENEKKESEKKADKLNYDNEGNIKVSRTSVKGTITQDVNTSNLTLRLFLTKEQKNDLLLNKGKQPNNMMDIIIM